MEAAIDPFKTIGRPETWEPFGTDDDILCDAERRAFGDHFARRTARLIKRGHSPQEAFGTVMSGLSAGMAGAWFAAQGGVDNARTDDFDKWIGVMTYSYYQALGGARPA